MTITSQQNRALKEIRKLRQRRRWRDRAGRFVAEGEDLLAAADEAGWEPVERYSAAGSGLPGVEVEADALASVSGLASGTRALAVYEERWLQAPVGPMCVYLHGVSDPGNVGAILRSAAAFGASSVALGPGSADPFSPKAVRASMGAVFAVPLARVDSVKELPGVRVALVPGAGRPLGELWRASWSYDSSGAKVPDEAAVPPTPDEAAVPPTPDEAAVPPTPDEVSLLVGAEREGLPQPVIQAAHEVAHIPIATHSLNAAMAVTVALYELATRMPRP